MGLLKMSQLSFRFFSQQSAATRCQYIPACCFPAKVNICHDSNAGQHKRGQHQCHQPQLQQTANYCSVQSSPQVAGSRQYKDKKFAIFYRLPSIRIMKVLSRLKIYQTGAVLFGMPPFAFLYNEGSVSGDIFASYCAIASLAGLMLYVMSHYFRRLIGLMSLSECKGTVRLSHLTFWGKRNDVYVPVENIVPISDLPERATDAYIKIRRYDTSDVLFLTLRWGQVVDSEKFSAVFGNIKVQ